VGIPGPVLADYPGAPTVTALGHLLGWDPLPLTVREARAHARRTGTNPTAPGTAPDASTRTTAAVPGEALVTARAVTVELGGRAVLHDLSLDVRAGEVVALLGRNGAGKTTLLRALGGLVTPTHGTVTAHVAVGCVPQDPNSLLFSRTVRAELHETLHLLGRPDDGAVDRWLGALGLHALADRHPRSLSGGERQRVAIGAVAVGGAPVLLLDEPTRGMDATARRALREAVRAHTAAGGAVVLATHDVELAAECATTAVVLGDGDVVAQGDARGVLATSLFAPQVSRVLPPFLTVAEVEAALDLVNPGERV
jgi:energy-coupling factor transport system ATP-binding protein